MPTSVQFIINCNTIFQKKKQWLSPTAQWGQQTWVCGPSKFVKHFPGPQSYVDFENMWNKCHLGTVTTTRIPKGLPANTGWMPQAYAKSSAAKSNWKRNFLLLLADLPTASGVGSFSTMSWGAKSTIYLINDENRFFSIFLLLE